MGLTEARICQRIDGGNLQPKRQVGAFYRKGEEGGDRASGFFYVTLFFQEIIFTGSQNLNLR